MSLNITPGPWFVGDLDHASQRVVRQEHIEICTCWHHSVGSIEREMEANARLIAAAPDLYAALEFVRSNYAAGDTKVINATIDTALAKARGEP
jgi:hypothetical protein